MEEEPGPSNKCIWKSKCVAEKQERRERLNTPIAEADTDAVDF
jgi:hypothetical protein